MSAMRDNVPFYFVEIKLLLSPYNISILAIKQHFMQIK